jgi:hypothetical protein
VAGGRRRGCRRGAASRARCGGDEDEQPDIDPIAQHRCREGRHGLRNDDHVGAITDRLHHRVRVLTQAGCVVVGRQSGVRTSCPRLRNRRATKRQYHESPPAPGSTTNVAVIGDASTGPLGTLTVSTRTSVWMGHEGEGLVLSGVSALA